MHIISGREEAHDPPLKKGAIGYLTKPVAKQAIDGALTKIETLLQSELKHLLLVEDDHDTQIAVRSLLHKKDIHIAMRRNWLRGPGAAVKHQI